MKIQHLCICISGILICSCKSGTNPGDFPGNEVDDSQTFFQAMETNTQWPSYRGFYATGYLNGASLPDSFNVETSYLVKWKTEIPGLGLSCPVIWNDRVYVTSAISEQDRSGFRTGLYGDIESIQDSSVHTWMLYCLDKDNGDICWEQVLHEGIPLVKRHPKSTHANTTVATNGSYIVVFLGSEGLYCYNTGGEQIWKTDFGPILSAWNLVPSAEWEFSSSPLIFRDRVIVQADALNQDFIAVLDLHSGKVLWKKERNEISNWCSPNIYFRNGNPCVVVNGYKHRGGYDLETGEEIWQMSGGGDIPIPTPVVWKDLIFFNSAHGKHFPLFAVKNSAAGTIAYPENDSIHDEAIAWFRDRGGAYMSSVLVYDSLLYRMRWNGSLACMDPRTGEVIYQETVSPESFVASPVAADGKLFLVSENGTVFVVKSGRDFEIISESPLGDVSLVAPGVTKKSIIFRTSGELIAIGKESVF